jgi:hypothetical protein
VRELNLPQYPFKITGKEGGEMIFDEIRRKYVRLTPEEWVRQNFVRYLVVEGRYPPGLMAIEASVRLNTMKRRVDVLVHSRRGTPLMVIECKEPAVKIDDSVFDQAVAYNMALKTPYIVVTNGIDHYACRVDVENRKYEFLHEIPLYDDLETCETP